MEFAFFTQQTANLLLPFVYQFDPYFLNSFDMCSTNEIIEAGTNIQQEHKKYVISFKMFGYFFSFY